MKRIIKKTWLMFAVLLLGTGSVSAVYFENNLTDASGVAADFNEYISSHNNSAWSYTDDYALAQDGTTNTFLQGGAVLDWVIADDDTARSFLGTVYSNWMGQSWIAHIGVETVNGDPKNNIFFGLGDPTPNESAGNLPQTGESVYVYWQSGNSGSKIKVNRNGTDVVNTGAWQGDPGYDIYMTYNHINKTIQFEVDNWNGGRFSGINVDSGEISIDGFLTDTNTMHIFFGANAKVTFRDFDVAELVEEPVTSSAQWFTVEAEDYATQSGVKLETCSDTGGGQNVAYISNGDWCRYEDIVLGTDPSLLKFRAARPDGGDAGKIEVRLDSSTGTLLGEVDVPETGGWQNWETLSFPFSGIAGTNDVVLVFPETGTTNGGSIFNLNWWARAPLIEAEGYDDGAGYKFETTQDIGGGQNLGWIAAGEWMEYTLNVETTGLHQIDFRVASDGGSAGIAMVSGGVTNGVLSVSDTGGWQAWETQSTYINFTETGEQTLRLEFLAGGFNLNWFSYEQAGNPVSVMVGNTPKQMMRYGIDYERLWYWYGSGLDPVPDWSVNDCNVDYVRTAMNSAYELEEGTYNLNAYTSKIIPMMTAMQNANPSIKWFASPRPLNEAVSSATWQPYPLWVTGASSYTAGDYDFDATKCAEYMIRYLLLMKSYGFKISYMDLTNEWQTNYESGGRFSPEDAVYIKASFDAYLAAPWPHPALDSNLLLEADDFPQMIGASSWNYDQGSQWISKFTTTDRRNAIDIASSHNTDKTGTAQQFSDAAAVALGSDAEVWETEQHGWKGNSTSSEAMSFSYMIETVRAGFTGISGWLAIGTTSQGHSYMLNNGTTVTRNVKYYMFKKLSNTSNFGYALDIDQTETLTSTMALVRDNLLTIWVINTGAGSALTEFDISGHTRDGSAITWTRWDEDLPIDASVTPEGVSGVVSEADASSFTVQLEGRATYCFEIPLVDHQDNFPFVQAESYATGSGVAALPCSDTDGGNMVEFSDVGDEITFDLDVTKTSSFGIGFRVSSAGADIAFELYDGDTLLATVDQPTTGGAQNWTTVYQGLSLEGGPMDLKIVATSGGWNLNWIEFEQGTVPAAPSGLYSTLSTLSVDLDWDAVDGVSGYDVKRSTVYGSGYTSIGSTTGLTYTDSNVEEGQTYYYIVSAANQYGENDSTVVTGYGLPYAIIGPASSYVVSRPDLEKDNLFDKAVNTFYDTTDQNSWAGLDFGANNEQRITQVDYVLRDWTYSVPRTTNATFQGANNADFSDAEILYMVPTDVAAYPAVNTAVITNTKGFRYFRMLAAPGLPLYGVSELDVTSVSAMTANGTPIAWLESYGLTSADDELDDDGDGLFTWEEYIAGLNPTNTDSLVLSGVIGATNNSFSWDAVRGRLYNVYWTSNLTDGFTLIKSNALNGIYIDTEYAGDDAGFYKITVELEPEL